MRAPSPVGGDRSCLPVGRCDAHPLPAQALLHPGRIVGHARRPVHIQWHDHVHGVPAWHAARTGPAPSAIGITGVSRLFDTIVIIDWSARSTPSPVRPSGDAIWWAVARGKTVETPVYFRTRHAAMNALKSFLSKELEATRRVLVGFDFPFGYPAGVAKHLTGRADALSLWDWLDARIQDGPDNANNRFDVASEINALYDGTGPFWGRPATWDFPLIPTRGTERHGQHPPDRRLVEQRQPSAQPVWKLYTTGSVGSQVLLGIPALNALRKTPGLVDAIQVWPFQTGLARPTAPIVLAEIYPSLIADRVAQDRYEDEILDAAQVRVNALAYAELDAAGVLSAAFRGPTDATPQDRFAIETEEAWILGLEMKQTLSKPVTKSASVGKPANTNQKPQASIQPLRYLRDPAEIARAEQAVVVAESRLDHLPDELRAVARSMITACGMPDIAARLAWSPDFIGSVRAALQANAVVLCDCPSIETLLRIALQTGKPRTVCTYDDPATHNLAMTLGTTQAAASLQLWKDRLAGSIVAIGSAPTALFHLLELVDQGWPRPAALVGLPSGLVGAAEAKAELARHARQIPFLTLRGRRGGPELAAAALAALVAT